VDDFVLLWGLDDLNNSASLRATLVLGVIAAILTLRLDPMFGKRVTEFVSLNALLIYLGLYAGLLAIGVEKEPFGERFAALATHLAGLFFFLGPMILFLESSLLLFLGWPTTSIHKVLAVVLWTFGGFHYLGQEWFYVWMRGRIQRGGVRSTFAKQFRRWILLGIVMLPLYFLP